MKILQKKCLVSALIGLCLFPQVSFAEEKAKEDKAPAIKIKTTDKTDFLSKKSSSKEEKKDNKKTKTRVLETQTGELLDSAFGDVDGDGEVEEINLMGSSIINKSNFRGDIYLIAKDKNTGKIKNYFRPRDLGGYNASLTLSDVTGNGVDNVLISADTGGSGGIVDYRIVDFSRKEPEEIFGKNNNHGIDMIGKYLADHRAELRFPSIDKRIQLDLSGDEDMYRHLNIYDAQGNVKGYGIRPYVQDLTGLVLLDVDNDGVDEVITSQRIVGGVNSNSLGHIIATWKYQADTWQTQKIQFQTDLYARNQFNRENKIVRTSGYTVNKISFMVDNNDVSYPSFLKMENKKQQWKLNSQIENFISKEIKDVAEVGNVSLNYELKYLGKNYVSILIQGIKVIKGKDRKIKKAFNFDVRTGESIGLEALVVKTNDFWKKVAEEEKVQKITFLKKDLQDFYYDGVALTLINKDNKEILLPLSKVGEYLVGNKMGEKILTKQSNGDKKSILAKK